MDKNSVEGTIKVSSIINLEKINYIIWESGYVFQSGEVLPVWKTDGQKMYDSTVSSEMILRIVFNDQGNDIYCCREKAVQVYEAYRLYLGGPKTSKSYVELGEFDYIHKD